MRDNRNHGAWQPTNRVYVPAETINPRCVGYQETACEHVQLTLPFVGFNNSMNLANDSPFIAD
jgi:hypothetical protein